MSRDFETILSAAELARIIERLAGEISNDHPDGLVLIGTLNATFTLMADLVRALSVPCTVDFLSLSRYAGSSERVRILKDLELDVVECDVVLVEEIVDTGLSSQYVSALLEARGARHVSICTLLDRPARRILPLSIRYVGHEVGGEYLVGYGLDHRQRFRNLREIVAIDPERVDDDPEAFASILYRHPPV